MEGFDTETFQGNIKVICNSYSYYEPNPQNPMGLLNWLYAHAHDKNAFYNLKFDFSVILKNFINEDNGQSVRQQKELKIGNYYITFVDRKYFSLRLGHKQTKYFYDFMQFFNDNGKLLSLNEASKKYLNLTKIDENLDIDREKIGKEKGYYEANREKIIKYCMYDAFLVKKLAELRVKEFTNFLGIEPKHFISPASISKAYLDLRHKNEKYAFARLIKQLPVDLQKTAFDYITACYHGGIFADFLIGKVENVSDYDINSAYPFYISQLKSIDGATISYTDRFISDSDYGFYKVKMKFTEDLLFPFRQENGIIIFPKSVNYVINYLTTPEILYLKENGHDIKIIDGFVISDCYENAFIDFKDLYEKRQKAKKDGNSSLQYVLKLILNATYGCFAENRHRLTQYSNMVYASYITALTRIQIMNKIKEIQSKGGIIVSVRTDSIIYANNVDLDESNEIGMWKYEYKNALIYNYMSGFSIVHSNNDMFISKRGFRIVEIDKILNAKGHILEIVDKNPLSLAQGIIQHRIDQIGNFEQTIKKFDLWALTQKYQVDLNELNFENLNKRNIKTKALIVNHNPDPYQINDEFYYEWLNKSKFVYF